MKRFSYSRTTAYPLQRGRGLLPAHGRDGKPDPHAGAGAASIPRYSEPIPPCRALVAH